MLPLLKLGVVLVALLVAYFILVRTRTDWVLNRFMLLGAGLGIALFFLISDIAHVIHHKGPGYVTYGEEDVDEHTEKVSEVEYKRHNLILEGFVLMIAVVAWIEGAKRAKRAETVVKGPKSRHPLDDSVME